MALQTSGNNSYSDDLRSCLCSVCKSVREYEKRHPDRHTKVVRDYYIRNRDDILLTNAFNRHQSGGKTRPETLKKLIKAEYPVREGPGHNDPQMQPRDSVAQYVAIQA
jgi:hypothetical protein